MQDQEDRIIASHRMMEDQDIDMSLRPRRMVEYIGQEKIKDKMSIYIKATQQRGDRKSVV